MRGLTLDEQLEIFDRQADASFEDMMTWAREHKAEILVDARKRFKEGFQLYGSAMWRWNRTTLFANRRQELSDGTVYGVPIRERGWQ